MVTLIDHRAPVEDRIVLPIHTSLVRIELDAYCVVIRLDDRADLPWHGSIARMLLATALEPHAVANPGNIANAGRGLS